MKKIWRQSLGARSLWHRRRLGRSVVLLESQRNERKNLKSTQLNPAKSRRNSLNLACMAPNSCTATVPHRYKILRRTLTKSAARKSPQTLKYHKPWFSEGFQNENLPNVCHPKTQPSFRSEVNVKHPFRSWRKPSWIFSPRGEINGYDSMYKILPDIHPVPNSWRELLPSKGSLIYKYKFKEQVQREESEYLSDFIPRTHGTCANLWLEALSSFWSYQTRN